MSPSGTGIKKRLPVQIILEDIRSQHNVGAIFRNCDAFLVSHIWLCGITPVPPHRGIHKTALGATEFVPWTYRKEVKELVNELKKNNISVIAIEQSERAKPLHEFIPGGSGQFALIFGNEVTGISNRVLELCDGQLEIPQAGLKKSLNVAVSNGIVLWHFFTHLAPKG